MRYLVFGVVLVLTSSFCIPAQTGTTGAGAGKQGVTKKVQKPEEQKGKGDKDKKKVEKDTVVDLPPSDEPLPMGADPEDLRAMRGQQQMLEAERRLTQMIKTGKIKDVDQMLSFEEISSWPYEDGLKGLPKTVKKLDERKVMMTGFMLPIDQVENIKEFLLVQSLWSCCYGQPPDINGIVRVVMKGKTTTDYQFDPIKIVGDFKVEAAIEDGYCVDIFQLHADSVEVIK